MIRTVGAALAGVPAVSRRSFLRLSGVGLVTALAGTGLLAACTEETLEEFLAKIANRPVRRDIASLSGPNDPVLQTYRAAVSAMKALDSDSTNPHGWTRQARIHLDHCPHGNWLFLPWHRAYLWYFEEICRQLTGEEGFALPYWNWTANPTIPAAFFDQSSPLFDGTRTMGPNDSLNTNIVGQTNIDTIQGETNFLNYASGKILLTDTQRTPASQGPLESGPHNHVHGAISGNMGAFMSPLDPVFWLHHNRIDQLWVDWNITKGNPNTNDSDWTSRHYTDFFDRQKQAVDVATITLILLPLLSYRYDTQVP